MIKSTFAFLAVCAGFYMFGAFVSWESDPGEWKESLRAFIGFMGGTMAVIVAVTWGMDK